MDSLSGDMKSGVKKIKESMEGILSLNEVIFHLTKGIPLDQMNHLLKSITEKLLRKGKQMPIFFIDIGSSHYNTYIFGHLYKGDARRYWESTVVADNMNLLNKRGLDPLKFESTFTVCGGVYF